MVLTKENIAEYFELPQKFELQSEVWQILNKTLNGMSHEAVKDLLHSPTLELTLWFPNEITIDNSLEPQAVKVVEQMFIAIKGVEADKILMIPMRKTPFVNYFCLANFGDGVLQIRGSETYISFGYDNDRRRIGFNRNKGDKGWK